MVCPALDGRWSYRHANRADFDTAIAALNKKVETGISPNDFGIELQKIIALGIDGHAVAEFEKTFRPEWDPPKSQFSDWHYMALNRLAEAHAYHYTKPVVLLMNAKCFSATDIFLAGLKGMKNVTLLGTPSGGGSARSQRVDLGETPYRLRLGSMASFQANGKLFDGNGVRPDVVLEPVPEYHIGGRDNALEEALEWIKDR